MKTAAELKKYNKELKELEENLKQFEESLSLKVKKNLRAIYGKKRCSCERTDNKKSITDKYRSKRQAEKGRVTKISGNAGVNSYYRQVWTQPLYSSRRGITGMF